MPSALKFTIGGDATPFAAAMKVVENLSLKAGTQTKASLSMAKDQLLKAASATDLTTRQTNFYAQSLQRVESELQRVIALENAVANATNKSSEARAIAAAVHPAAARAQTRGNNAMDRDLSIPEAQAKRNRRQSAIDEIKDREERKKAGAKAYAERAREESVDTASRSNRARELLRQRAEARSQSAAAATDQARQDSVDTASRSNRARELRKKRLDDRVKSEVAGVAKSGRERQSEKLFENLFSSSKQLALADASGNPVEIAAARKGKADAIRAVRAYQAQFSAAGRGRAFGGASSAMFVSVARDTAASLASGANPLTVMMQQGPQVAQAMTMLPQGSWIRKLTSGLVRPLGAAGAAGGAAYSTGFMASLAKMPVLVGGIALASVAAIVGSIFIFKYRVEKAVKDMVGPMREAFSTDHIAKYLQKAATLTELQKNVTTEVNRTRDAHDSVISSMDRELDLTLDRIKHERELLEIRKQNELATAKSPKEREAIEKKFSGMLLANKKAERDAELHNMVETAYKLPGEIEQKQARIKEIISQPDYRSEEADQRLMKEREDDFNSRYKEYFDELPAGGKDKREFSAEKDRATVNELGKGYTDIQVNHAPGLPATTIRTPISEAQKQQLQNAQARLEDARERKSALQQWQDAAGDRRRKREEVKGLESQVVELSKKQAELGISPPGTMPSALQAMGKLPGMEVMDWAGAAMLMPGKIMDTLQKNAQRDQEDSVLEQERMKRIKENPGKSAASNRLTDAQQHGAYAGGAVNTVLNVNKSMDRTLKDIKGLLTRNPTYSPPKIGGMKTR